MAKTQKVGVSDAVRETHFDPLKEQSHVFSSRYVCIIVSSTPLLMCCRATESKTCKTKTRTLDSSVEWWRRWL